MTVRKPTLVPIYPGLTDEEAMRLQFGTNQPPGDADLVMVRNALPPDGVGYDWAQTPRGSAEFIAGWDACRSLLVRQSN